MTGPRVRPADIRAWDYRSAPPQGGAPGGVMAVPPSPIAFPVGFYPPLGSQYFRRQGNASIGPGPAASWVVPSSIILLIPPLNVGVLKYVAFYVNNMTPTTNISFSLRTGEGPIAGFDNQVLFPRIGASVSEDFPDITVRLGDGVKIDAMVTVNDAGGPYLVGVTYWGYFYPNAIGGGR